MEWFSAAWEYFIIIYRRAKVQKQRASAKIKCKNRVSKKETRFKKTSANTGSHKRLPVF
jgi:hypothetical protein